MIFRRTVTAPFLVLICYLAMTLSSFIDPDELSTGGNIYLSVIVLQMLIFLIPGIIYCKLRGEETKRRLCIRSIGPRKFAFSLFAFIATLTGSALIKLGLYAVGYSSTSYTLYENYVPTNSGGFGTIIYVLVALAILPAITEEFVFRGIVLQEYRAAGVSRSSSLIISALLFSMIHFNLAQLPVYFFGGLMFGAVFMVTNSIVAAVLVHLLNNAMSLFFEPQLLLLITRTNSTVFVLFTFAVIFLLFLILAIHEAEVITYDRGEEGEEPPFPPVSRKNKAAFKEKLLEAVLSPTFLLCIAAFFAVTFGIKRS